MMAIQSPRPNSVEAALSFTPDLGVKKLLCNWTSGAETWHERINSVTERKNICGPCSLNFPSGSSNQSTMATKNCAPTFVYQRKKLQPCSTSVFPAQTSMGCNSGVLNSKSLSINDDLQGPTPGMLKTVDTFFVNDSCSSSKSNMDLRAVTMKNDTGECSSSSDDSSEKDVYVSVLRQMGLYKEGVAPINTQASLEVRGVNSNSSCLLSCKVCDRTEITLKMLICDQCEEAFHVSCCIPRVKKMPVAEWFCHFCFDTELGPGPIAAMLEDSKPYTTQVRIGPEFQVEIPDCSGPVAAEVDNMGVPLEIRPSGDLSFQDVCSRKPSRLNSICNWLQCRQVIDGVDGAVCGKWRRAPLFEIQNEKWECFCSFLWDPAHADCAVPQELDTDQVLRDLKYIEMLRSRLAAKKRKLGCIKSVVSGGPA